MVVLLPSVVLMFDVGLPSCKQLPGSLCMISTFSINDDIADVFKCMGIEIWRRVIKKVSHVVMVGEEKQRRERRRKGLVMGQL